MTTLAVDINKDILKTIIPNLKFQLVFDFGDHLLEVY